ncbi:MAG: hypothetical protein JO332_14440 [Planctomycetaceae bacterium]|nr:hypothetical protein [Planctomycetaceae bacterium]
MRRVFAAVLLLSLPAALGCPEPPKLAQMDDMIASLSTLRVWDPYMQGKGNLSYDSIMGYGPDIYPVLIDHLTDETPTAIYDDMSGRNPKICDAVLLMLLVVMKKKWQDFSNDGLFVSTALPNPIFCIKWDRQAKIKVQFRFRQLLENPPEEK